MIIERPGRAASDAVSDHVALADPHSQYAEITGQVFTGSISATNLSGTNTGDQDLSGKADQATTYTETEVDSLLDNKAATAGQTFTGDIAAPKITASTGILFGTDTAAANTLDDYEQGAWTPSVVSQSNMTGTTISTANYTKVGNLVFAELKGSFSVTSGASARTLIVFSLPILQSTDTTVVGGGGIIQAPSNLNVNPGIGDSTGSNDTDAFLSFISYETGSHTFSISITYSGA
jgi:hypothetical protein